ncbi:MAG: hypothetical protein MSC30_00390 [Gaiellaceae bacterium MAG52_C11]|nr:hypothetical protein [Candidatus Gaiellasilicea maunaloa]
MIVCPDESALAISTNALAPLAGVTVVETPLLPMAPARAAGVRAARAPIVVLGETHVFAEPDWAVRLLQAHDGPWVAVTPGIGNANPAGGLSWVGLLMDYGRFLPGGGRRETEDVASYNAAYKRADLLELGEELESLLEPGSPLHAELKARGGRFLHEPAARIDHLNVTRPGPWLFERYLGGRLFGATRSRNWPRGRALLYAAASPLVAPIRLVRTLRAARSSWTHLPITFVPALVLACVVWAVGEGLGYVRGEGANNMRRMLEYEQHKARYT